jgi:hypothetical protein
LHLASHGFDAERLYPKRRSPSRPFARPSAGPSDRYEWIEHIAQTGDEWLVVTGDQRIRRNKAEAQAFRRAHLRGLILASAYQRTPMHRCCAVIVHQWPTLFETISKFDPPFMLEMSINFSGRFKQLPV